MSNRNITDAILKTIGNTDSVFYANATVISVNIASRSCICKIVSGKAEYTLPNVMLMAVVEDGVLFEPVLNSTVKVIFSQNIEPFICQYSEIENITIDAKTSIKLNDGSLGGMVKINALLSKLNNIENRLNVIGTWAATVTPPLTVQPIIATMLQELENTKIKHGI
jgi:hypothetical protein